ncbi:TetR family transcriptional regulator [Mycobacterium dioxanotrophicus]|uniref:TetR family transcriptional regulator n=1 Tax=Mycobacterium dioxanotrophicus TaxID=482462 RepID=A0A1Y0CEJ1_9MYCO|nr:TetR family transcriptional regulator [Mycobacterium dioxanotrophicus]
MLRDEILSAATRVIDVAQTEAEVSLRSIAREAGIAAPSVYAHFEDRDQVLQAVVQNSWEQVCAQITERSKTGQTARDRVILGCRAYVAFAQRYPLRYTLMTQAAEVAPAARRALDVVTRGLLACRGADPTSEPTQASHRSAASLSVALHGVAMLHRTDSPNLWLSDFSTDDIIASLVDAAILRQDESHPADHQ